MRGALDIAKVPQSRLAMEANDGQKHQMLSPWWESHICTPDRDADTSRKPVCAQNNGPGILMSRTENGGSGAEPSECDSIHKTSVVDQTLLTTTLPSH